MSAPEGTLGGPAAGAAADGAVPRPSRRLAVVPGYGSGGSGCAAVPATGPDGVAALRRPVLALSVGVFFAAVALAAAGTAGIVSRSLMPAAIGLVWAAAAGYRFGRRDPAQAVVTLLFMGALWTIAIRV